MLAFPHLKPTGTSWSENCLRDNRRTPQTYRHPVMREGGADKNVRVQRRRAVTSALVLSDSCRGRSAQGAGSRAVVDGDGVWSSHPHCLAYAAAERNIVGSAVPIASLRSKPRRTSMETRVIAVEKVPGWGEPRSKR